MQINKQVTIAYAKKYFYYFFTLLECEEIEMIIAYKDKETVGKI